jgi:ACR3 family arsenite transporter
MSATAERASVAATALPPLPARLSFLDRFLPLWIVLAMALGVVLGRVVPGLATALDRVTLAGTSLPIAIGLLWMLYPVFARVRYEVLAATRFPPRLIGLSLALTWGVAPLLMFGLAWLFLPDQPHYRNGLILVGIAPCIGMVLVWTWLAQGDGELAAVLVALNSLLQIALYSVMGWVYLSLLPGWLGAETMNVQLSMWTIAKTVLLFLGIPFAAGALIRWWLRPRKGAAWYDETFLPRIGPTALLGLLYTIVLMFALQGQRITALPLDVLRIAAPLVAYFGLMFGLTFLVAWRLGYGYPTTSTLALTAAGNNFELAIAVAVGMYGIGSGEALAGTVGPLIEVPVLIGLVYISLWLKARLFSVGAGGCSTSDCPSGSTQGLQS